MITALRQKWSLGQHLDQWLRDRVLKRRGTLSLPFTIEYRHIYIVPTVFGFGFGAMLALMAMGGLNFNNNLALLEVFILATISVLTTFLAHRDLVQLQIRDIACEPVFAGGTARFRVYVTNPEGRNRFSIRALSESGDHCIDLAAHATAALTLEQPATRRGWLEMEAFRLETRFPLGLFRAWTWLFPRSRCMVWPRPAEEAPPLPRGGDSDSGRSRRGEGDEVFALREYQPGDSPRRIAWRTSARHDALYTREMARPRSDACELDWHQLEGRDPETRLSILTAWVIEADQLGIPFRLKLPGVDTALESGPEHRIECLNLLALQP